MSQLTDKYQQYQCPEEFQDRLNEIGGFNRYDKPNFIIRWAAGGEPECTFRSGGAWHVEGQPSYTGYRDILIGGGAPCWMLMQWDDAVYYGTPESFYIGNYDEESGLQDLGEYPYQGKYKVLYNLSWRDMSSGKLRIEPMPLNSYLIDTVVPIIMAAKEIAWEKTKAAMQTQKEKDDKADLDMIEDVMRDSSLAFKGPVSYARQGCRTSIIDKKVEEMTRHWNRMVTNAKALGRGLSSHEAGTHGPIV
jgi:hypothetical protein